MGLIINPYSFGGGGGGGTPATVGAVLFDGTNDYLSKASGLTGASDSDFFILSFWIQVQGGDGTTRYIFTDDADMCLVSFTTTNKIRITFKKSTFIPTLTIESNTAITDDNTWHHFMASVHTPDGFTINSYLYLDGVSDLVTIEAHTGQDADFTRSAHYLGANASGNNKLNADLAEFYFFPGAQMDLSNVANREKFIVSGKPSDLGSTGSLPTGSSPTVYLRHVTAQPATDFATNQGGGGNFTINGTLTQSANSPSD